MRDVIQEGVTGQDHALRADRRAGVALAQHVVSRAQQAVGTHADHQLWIAVGAGDEVAVLISSDQRDVADVQVRQLDAENVSGLLP